MLAAGIAAGFVLAAGSASALAVRISEVGFGSLVINDNAAGLDLDGSIGQVLYDCNACGGGLGGVFSPVTVEAESKPLLGSPSLAELGVTIALDSSNQAGTYQVEVTDTGYTLNSAIPWLGVHALGGITAGSVQIESFWDSGNTAFAQTNSIGGPFNFNSTVDPFEGFATTLFDTEMGSNPFSITTVFTIQHALGDELTEIVSGVSLAPVPVPAGLPLMLGALGMVAFLRRRKSA